MNPITGEWTIIATERAKRPFAPTLEEEVLVYSGDAHDPSCFFCYGNEHTTPAEVMCYREKPGAPNSPGWTLRVVPNKFSALNMDGEFSVETSGSLQYSSYARGRAEVIIESPHHSMNPALFPHAQTALILKAYKDRYNALSKDISVKYIAIFRNNGSPAGASLSHPHSQIIATPVVPPAVEQEMEGAKKYFEKHKRCVYCDMIESELKDKSRIICENDDFVSFAPYASKSPFETWVMPRFHSCSYNELNDKQLKSLAEIWRSVLYRIYKGLDNPPYNYFIHTAPVREKNNKFYHWHMELIPKMTIAAGFELGTGMYINIALPEHSAEFLREMA